MSEAADPFFKPNTIELLGEIANGGICSIAVNSILVDLVEVEGARREVEVRRRHFSEQASTQLGEFKPVAEQLLLDNFVSYQFGFFERSFGVLTEGKVFIPLVDFCDERSKKECSYALFNTSRQELTDSMVVTSYDEENIIVAIQEERGLVVAKEVLDLIGALVESKKPTGDSESNIDARTSTRRANASDITDKLTAVLDVEPNIMEVLNLDPLRDYSPEINLLINIDAIVKHAGGLANHEEVVVDTVLHDGQAGAATDNVVTTLIRNTSETDRHQVLVTCAFPNSLAPEPKTLLKLSIGPHVGRVAVDACIEEDRGVDEVIEYLDAPLTRGLHDGVQKRLVAEAFSPEVHEWVNSNSTLLVEHFKEHFPEYQPVFSPLIIERKGRRHLVLTDIGTAGLDLAQPVLDGGDTAHRRNLYWTKANRDLKLHQSNGKSVYLGEGFDRDVALALHLANPRIAEMVWLHTGKLRDRIANEKPIAILSANFVRFMYMNPLDESANIRFRPVLEYPFPISLS